VKAANILKPEEPNHANAANRIFLFLSRFIPDPLAGVIFGDIFADCDGVVAAEQEGFTYSDLLAKTARGQSFSQSTNHPGTNSPDGCGSNSNYTVSWHMVQQYNVRTFQSLTASAQSVLVTDVKDILVRGDDGNLWLEHAPFGKVPPARQQVDAHVLTIQGITDGSGDMVVLGKDGNLWLEQPPFGTVPPMRQQIDANVQAFYSLFYGGVLILGDDGILWD